MLKFSKLETLKQIWLFMKINKKWWLLPMMLVLISFGSLLIFAQGSAFAPFIYTFF